uniref:AAA_11 domain-containing protein n=1 Tax=Strongyloides papillosus TaxID=174720 RepID=A0A0N5B6W8_STREA
MMKSFGKLLYLVRFQNIKHSIPSVRYLASSKLLGKENTAKKPEAPLPVLFNEKLNLFKLGLEAKLLAKFLEINKLTLPDNIEKNSTGRNQTFYNLKAEKIYYHALHGNVIELCDNKLIGLSASIFPTAKPFVLKQNDKQFISYLMDYNPDNGTILLKLIPTIYEWKEIRTNSNFDLLPLPKNSFDSVLEFLFSCRFTKMPGWKTLESIYNESKSPKAYSDKPVRFNGEFNATQQNAIKAALNAERQILCIGGPPGTGKTQVIVEIVKQLLEDGQKILVVVPNPDVPTIIYERIDFTKYKACVMMGDEIIKIEGRTKIHIDFERLEYMASLISEIKEEDVSS